MVKQSLSQIERSVTSMTQDSYEVVIVSYIKHLLPEGMEELLLQECVLSAKICSARAM